MDGKELEIKRMGRFKTGDMVVFRMGERENLVCDCGDQFFNSEYEKMLVEWSGRVFQIRGDKLTGNIICEKCGAALESITSEVALDCTFTYQNSVYGGFLAYERELSPVSMENKNEI